MNAKKTKEPKAAAETKAAAKPPISKDEMYRIVRAPEDMTITDFWGLLKDGRMFALEAKRPSWKGLHTPREVRQAKFINLVLAAGGIGGFVRSSIEAENLLNG